MERIVMTPHLNLPGNCNEAMNFYKSVFGGELDIKTYDEVSDKVPVTDKTRKKVFFASLTGGDINLYAADTPQLITQTSHSEQYAGVSIALSIDSPEKLIEIFSRLSKGGVVLHTLKEAEGYMTGGSIRDKFNVEWLLDGYVQ
jgi:PhnB protein